MTYKGLNHWEHRAFDPSPALAHFYPGDCFPSLVNNLFFCYYQYISVQFLILGQKNMEIPVDAH